jgi:gliding motility-associated-like protein
LDSANCGKTGSFTVSPSAITGLGTPPLQYQWYDNGNAIAGQTSLILTGATGGPGNTYSLQVTDANGCHAIAAPGTSTTFTIPSVSSPSVVFSPSSPITATVSIPVIFTNQTMGANTYTWTFGDGNSFITTTTVNVSNTYTSAGTYTATLIASNGSCTNTLTALVMTDEATMIVIPNIFSPNGDNINDLFFIINTGMSSLNCTIFNRWGQLLYTIAAPNQSWDGKTPNGDSAPDGTYMYILQAQGLNGKTYKQNGTVTLIR